MFQFHLNHFQFLCNILPNIQMANRSTTRMSMCTKLWKSWSRSASKKRALEVCKLNRKVQLKSDWNKRDVKVLAQKRINAIDNGDRRQSTLVLEMLPHLIHCVFTIHDLSLTVIYVERNGTGNRSPRAWRDLWNSGDWTLTAICCLMRSFL